MPTPEKLEKAKLIQIQWVDDEVEVTPGGKEVTVQFNPETLSVAYANQKAGGDQRGGSAMQYVGQGTTKLTLELWFDATGEQVEGQPRRKDVRRMTQDVIHFITPQEEKDGDQSKWKAPGLRFSWGTFLFDGVVESISEKLEFFSEDGRPLRAQLSLGLSSQQIQFQFNKKKAPTGAAGASTPGTEPLKAAEQGQPLQKAAGGFKDWKKYGEANNVENPRHMTSGTLLNFNLTKGK